MATTPAPGPYFNGMCFEELAAMYPYRALAVIANNQGVVPPFNTPAYTAWFNALPLSPPAGGGWWNNGGSPTYAAPF